MDRSKADETSKARSLLRHCGLDTCRCSTMNLTRIQNVLTSFKLDIWTNNWVSRFLRSIKCAVPYNSLFGTSRVTSAQKQTDYWAGWPLWVANFFSYFGISNIKAFAEVEEQTCRWAGYAVSEVTYLVRVRIMYSDYKCRWTIRKSNWLTAERPLLWTISDVCPTHIFIHCTCILQKIHQKTSERRSRVHFEWFMHTQALVALNDIVVQWQHQSNSWEMEASITKSYENCM